MLSENGFLCFVPEQLLEQPLVFRRDVFPTISLANSLHGTLLVFRSQSGVVEHSLDLAREVLGGLGEGHGRVARYLPVLRRVQVEDTPATSHGLDQGRVGSPDLGGMDVAQGMGLQFPVPNAVSRARK